MPTTTTSPAASTSRVIRLGGAAAIAAAVLFALTTVLTQIEPIGTAEESATYQLHQVVLVLAYVATLVALLGLHARQRRCQRFGRLGAIGTVLALVGYGVVLLIVVGALAAGERILNEARMAAALVVLVGSVSLGVATLRARVLPWWCGVLLVVAFPVGDVADEGLDGAEGVLLALLWGSVGAALLQRMPSAREQIGGPG